MCILLMLNFKNTKNFFKTNVYLLLYVKYPIIVECYLYNWFFSVRIRNLSVYKKKSLFESNHSICQLKPQIINLVSIWTRSFVADIFDIVIQNLSGKNTIFFLNGCLNGISNGIKSETNSFFRFQPTTKHQNLGWKQLPYFRFIIFCFDSAFWKLKFIRYKCL